MRLLIIRHGDPDYSIDSLTEVGKIEAELLADRLSKMNVSAFYVSPLGRARRTAEPTLKRLGREAVELDWLREFPPRVKKPNAEKESIAWDWLPREYFSEEKYKDVLKWHSSKAMKTGNIEKYYKEVSNGIDSILESYDYTRIDSDKAIYNCFPHLTKEEAAVDTHLQSEQKDLDNKNIVFVCHLGVMFAIISHLTGISPVQLWQGFFVAPSSVTILGTEERVPGEVVFRVQQMGDVRHLLENGQTVSASGFFGNCLSY
jgi:probable phosphoglycerate mutase